MSDERPAPDIVLVTCVKSKATQPSPAKALYTSPLFRKSRAYAESTNAPWFILSAEHGLVGPEEWLNPYERYLADTTPTYQLAWGTWVAARLELLAGPLVNKVIEVHASRTYVDAVQPHLERLGALVVDPLRGLQLGQRLAWYGATDEPAAEVLDVVDHLERSLRDHSASVSPRDFMANGKESFDQPGLYSWWVDQEGANELSAGLGLPVEPGLIYAGLAGATRWPSGKRSNNTLWLRVMTMHLAGNHEFSTFRRSLGAIIAAMNGAKHVDESALTRWMTDHLRIVAVSLCGQGRARPSRTRRSRKA